MQQKQSSWQTVLDSNVDAALLQEAKTPPESLKDKISADYEGNWGGSNIAWCAIVAGLSDRIGFNPVRSQPLDVFEKDLLRVSYPGTISAG